MKSAKATRWSREAILAIGDIVAADGENDGGDQSGTDGGTGQADNDSTEGTETGDTDGADDEDPEKLKRKLQSRREQAARQDAEIKRLKKVEAEADELRKAKEETDRKGRTELENLKEDLKARDKALAAKDDTIRRLTIENAFMTLKEIEWNNPATALRLVDLSEVEFDEETGKVKDTKQLLEAAKSLAKTDPYLVKSKTAVGDTDAPNGRKTGQGPATKPGGKILDNDAIANKYNIHK